MIKNDDNEIRLWLTNIEQKELILDTSYCKMDSNTLVGSDKILHLPSWKNFKPPSRYRYKGSTLVASCRAGVRIRFTLMYLLRT